jgi:hypothetical protein
MVSQKVRFSRSVFTLSLQKSRVLQIRSVKGEAVVIYRKPFTTKELRCHRLSHWENNMAVSNMFMISFGVNPIQAEKKFGNADH